MRRLFLRFSGLLGTVLIGTGIVGCLLTAQAGHLKEDKAYDFYLSGDRICRKCHWRMAGPSHVELTGKNGIRGTYSLEEIIGVDKHPIRRRIHRKSIEGVGIPGRVIVPAAFDEERRLEAP